MTVRELLAKVRDKLQDTDSTYWSDSELIDLYNECKRYLSAERKESPEYIELPTYEGINVYTVENVLRFVSITDRNIYPDDGTGTEDTNGIIVRNYDKLYVNTPTDEVLTLKVITFPAEDNLNDTIRQGDEESYRYFILSKCYEKDNDMEQFQKAQYFWNMFVGAMKYSKKNSSLGYVERVHTTKSYFY